MGTRDVGPDAPTIEQAREALGGRVTTVPSHRVGTGCVFRDSRGRAVEGVVVCAAEGRLDVWIGDGRFQRIASERGEPVALGPDHALADVAADARVFASLPEGASVRFVSRDGTEREGVLAERCRYGALVSSGGRILAVSFRRIWPADGPAS